MYYQNTMKRLIFHYFRFSVNKHGGQYYGSFYFLVDEVHYALKDAYIGDDYSAPSGSATINIELSAGQLVRIENLGSTTILGTDSSGYIQS